MPKPASHASFLDTLLDLASSGSFLGTLPELAGSTSSHSLDQEEEQEPAKSVAMPSKPASEGENEVKLVDLFKKKRMKGWWPVYQGTELTVSEGKEQSLPTLVSFTTIPFHLLYFCHFVYSVFCFNFQYVFGWFTTEVFTFFSYMSLRSVTQGTKIKDFFA